MLTLAPIAAKVTETDLQVAWLALAAVLLGALISGGFNVWVAWRKEHVDAVAERRRREVEVRRAARVIDTDLLIAAAAARTTVVSRQWWFGGQPLTSKGWQQYRDVIASYLSANAWNSLIVAIMAIDHLQMQRDFAVKLHRAKMATDPTTAAEVAAAVALDIDIFEPVSKLIADADLGRIETALNDLERGRAALAPLTLDEEST